MVNRNSRGSSNHFNRGLNGIIIIKLAGENIKLQPLGGLLFRTVLSRTSVRAVLLFEKATDRPNQESKSAP